MHYEALFQSNFIKAAGFDGECPTWTIKAVAIEPLADDKGNTKDKGVVWFREIQLGWVLNKTNAQCVAAMFGDDTDGWIGKRVTLCAETVSLGREKVLGVRVAGSPDITRAVVATIKLPRKKPATRRLEPTGKPAAPYLADVLEDAGLSVADCDEWRRQQDKGPVSDLTETQRGKLAEWLAANPARLEVIRAAVNPTEDPPDFDREPGEEG